MRLNIFRRYKDNASRHGRKRKPVLNHNLTSSENESSLECVDPSCDCSRSYSSESVQTTTTGNAKIEVRNLTKRFGDLLVLDDISFTVHEGEFVSIVGPTGCGKTTFLNTLSKLIPTTSGDIFIDGVSANPKKHNLAFIFQEPTCLPWRTVRENVAYGMEVKRFSKSTMQNKIDTILDLVGLTECANLYPNQVSASMTQRIAVARAFAVNPDLLLMDEPYGQLDVKFRLYLEDELVRLWQTLKSTVIFVTHNIEEAVYVSERILILSNKPTKIKAEIKVDLPRPRSLIDPRFVEIRKEVTDLIRWW